MVGGARERLNISADRIEAEVTHLKDNHMAPVHMAVAERLGVTDGQLRKWLYNHTQSTGAELGVIPAGKVTEVLCLSLGEHFHRLHLEFRISDLARILQEDPQSLHTTLRAKKGVMDELKRLGLVIKPKRQY